MKPVVVGITFMKKKKELRLRVRVNISHGCLLFLANVNCLRCLLDYLHFSCFTFCALPEVREIVVVCDPSYQDIFEGM